MTPMDDFFACLLDGGPSEPRHANLWPGVGRALCSGAVCAEGDLSEEAYSDEDADVTCEVCLQVVRAARE